MPIPTTNHVEASAPTIDAYERTIDGVVQWVVWCDHCQALHTHGPAEGHRWAHCHDAASPYQASGYNLRFVGRWVERG